ncbi:beta strand repeat-containing protein [Deinococcus sp.]|uniref:beta strand repeat-containing protein n=1 Tax=Deinococcus sp. TaxID=47478 RepID=UPI003CC5B6DD
MHTLSPRHVHSRVPRLSALGLALSLGLLSACGQGEPAPVGIPVTSTADSGAGSLRELLAAAAPGDTLRFTAGGTLTLSSPLTLSKNVTLIADGVTVDTAGKPLLIARDAAVSISGGSWTSSAPLTTTGLAAQATTITSGGVIQNAGTLTLENLSISGGTANLGGGVRNDGTLTLNAGARITGNKAVGSSDTTADSGEGGGIYNTGTLTLAGGSVDGNTALGSGGGIRSTRDAKLFIQSGSVDGNSCTLPVTKDGGCAGGGIYSTGDVSLSGGSVSNNTATYFGGGLAVQDVVLSGNTRVFPTLSITGGTLAGNRASDAAQGAGGAVWSSAKFTLAGGTLKGNSAYYGGGIQNWGTLNVTGGSIEGNSAAYGGGISAYRPASNADFAATTFTFGGTASVKGNTASDAGGGLYVTRIPLTMTGGTVEDNTATNTGGGITFGSGTVSSIQGGTVSGNKVTGTTDGGGGLRLFGGTTVNLSGGEIRGNTAVKTGGGVTVGGTLNMSGGSITGNTVTNRTNSPSGQDFGGGGGGVRMYSGSSMTASGGSIGGNTAWFGGGVQTSDAYQTSPTSIFTLSGATVSGNKATDNNVGGGFWNDGKLTIQSGSVTGNSARDGGGVWNTRVSSYSKTGGDVSGNTPNDVAQGQ